MSENSAQAVSGVWPIELGEAHIHQTLPSISSSGLGRFLGSIYGLPFPIGLILHMISLPVPILLSIMLFLFRGFRRYVITSTRVCVRHGFRGSDSQEVMLSELEDVRLVARAGQAFYGAADLELVVGGRVALTLAGVPRAEAFLHNILESRDAFVQVQACREQQEMAVAAS